MKLGLSSWVTPKTQVLARVTVFAPRPCLRERGRVEGGGGVCYVAGLFLPASATLVDSCGGLLFQFFFTVVRHTFLGTLSLAYVIRVFEMDIVL